MKECVCNLVERMTGRADVAEICARAVVNGSDEDGTRGGGDVCCRLDDRDAALLGEVPQVVASVTAGSDPDMVDAPFALCGNLLYTRRSWRYEQIVRRRVGGMSAAKWMPGIVVPREGEYATLREVDQLPAVPRLLATRFSILTGGPGTGKTFTLGKAVKLLRERNPEAMVALAAPTGKAAARINESLEDLKRQGLLDGVQPATTLHALLKPRPDFVTFRHDGSNPLPLDWLVVDEASMIDLPLMAKLLEALPETCALTLIGDAHQLASVEQGRVFGDLCGMFAQNVARLTVSSRFSPGGTIDRLARAVNSGGDDAFAEVKGILEEGRTAFYRDIGGDAFSPDTWGDFRVRVQDGFGEFASSATPEDALESLKRFRILCALRKGPYGVETLNGYVESVLGKECPRPVMITQNDRMLDVHNGDVGVVMPRRNSQEPQYLCLPTLKHGVRKIRVELLPGTEPAFATTIHKSQGSEYGDVAIVLPPKGESPLLTREILYTGITRTKGSVHIYAGDASVEACCRKSVERVTGLA
jgi:exodeoxyribonuclease V alpha subunit